ncbi:MAG: cupin domain-containing protein [Alphaproteobacteria bacterium]|jgi:mannose-6-phosphate isomerase-like protein (cupin superfamily)|nr:cupin domain-containing protein [Alphaproteobacteria bacterium]
MAIIKLDDVSKQSFPNGATYQTIVGDEDGSTPVRIGVQVSPPGYSTGTHSHPYMEVVSVLEGTGIAWMEGVEGTVEIGPGTTLAMPPNVKHGFRATGSVPLKTYGVHASSERTVHRFPELDD